MRSGYLYNFKCTNACSGYSMSSRSRQGYILTCSVQIDDQDVRGEHPAEDARAPYRQQRYLLQGRHGQWLLNGYDLPHTATSEELLTLFEAAMAGVRLPHAHGPRLGPRRRDRLQHRHRHLHNDKGQYKQDQCRALARVTQSADSRAQSAERRAQHAERRAQSTERRARSAEATQGTATTNVPMAHRRRDHVGEARSRSQTCVARSTCKAKRSHRVSARKEAAQVRTARTLPWRKRIVHEDNEVARRSPAPALRQQSESDGS